MVFEPPVEEFIFAAYAFFLEARTMGDRNTLQITDRRRQFQAVEPHRERLARKNACQANS